MNQNKQSPPFQWNSVPQQQPYPTSPASDLPAQNGCAMPSVHGSTSPTSLHTSYYNPNNAQPPQYPGYYNTPSNYPPSSPGNNQQMYPNIPMNYGQPYPSHHHHHSQSVPPPQSSVPHTGYQSHAYLNPYSQSSSLPNPQTQVYGVPRNASSEKPEEQPYIQEVPQTIGISSDYPTFPGKPYNCDLCALSFSRQHDLKRHRETHNGEKPHFCKGGCGKTFTRKDALKRHQLVKNCGEVDPSTRS